MNNLVTQLEFTNKKVWVTGAGSGIGLNIALSFTSLGAKVVGIDRDFIDTNYPFCCEIADISSELEVRKLFERLCLNEKNIDILINAAGVLCLGDIEYVSTTDWEKSLATNVSAIFYMCKKIAPIFKKKKSGVIITVASNAATTARLGMIAYCPSKAAALSLTICIGLELAEYNVRCNTVSPGSTDTPMLQKMLSEKASLQNLICGFPDKYKLGIPLKKIATPEEITQSVLFLASDMASHITMQNIIVDGGATLNS